MLPTARSLLALCLAAVAPAALAATPVALLPASGANVDPGTLSAAHEVFRVYVEQAGKYELRVTRLGAVSELEPSPLEAVATAQGVGTNMAAVLRLAQLGSNLHVRLSVYGAPDGQTLWSDSLPAGTPADLDPVLKRLATGWARGVKAASAAEIDTVTEKEAQAQARKEATRQFGFRLGMLRAYGTADGSEPGGRGVGIFWLYDARSFLLDVNADAYWGSQVHNTSFGFGGYLPLLRGEIAPYVGGGLRLAWTEAAGDWNEGFQPYIAGGVIAGRLSTVGMRAEVNWSWNTFENAGARTSLLVGSLGVQF